QYLQAKLQSLVGLMITVSERRLGSALLLGVRFWDTADVTGRNSLLLIGIWFFARPLVLDAARVRENWFSLSFIPAPSCQTWRRASTGRFCRFSGGFAPLPRP